MYVFIYLVKFEKLSGRLLGNICLLGLRNGFLVYYKYLYVKYFQSTKAAANLTLAIIDQYQSCLHYPRFFEKHVNKHLTAYMNKYNLIHESQSDFRQKHSCQTARNKLTDQWIADIDKDNTIGSMCIDFRKAFDLVDHKILIRNSQYIN